MHRSIYMPCIKGMDIKDIASWPPGKSMCIFFGPTPSSKSSEVRAYSAVSVFGEVVGDARIFRAVKKERESKLKLHDLLSGLFTANFPIFYENFPAPAYHTCKPLRFAGSIAKSHHRICA